MTLWKSESHASIADKLPPGAVSTIDLKITEDMVDRFAHLTGDHSSLHTDMDFARKSIYRQKVVHGMLPVAFVSLLDFFKINGYLCTPVSLEAKFVGPVFIGEELTINGRVSGVDKDKGQAVVSYEIIKSRSGVAVTSGKISVEYVKEVQFDNETNIKGDGNLISNPIKMQSFKLEDISKGKTMEFGFKVTERSEKLLLEILAEGDNSRDGTDIKPDAESFFYPNLLSAMLYSTSVGMCIPGKYATFLDFYINMNQPIKLNTEYSLKEEVVHASRSTRMIKKEITIHKADDESEVASTGKVGVLVNQPPATMPEITELKKSAYDFGLKDKVVLITGASRGIGETTVKMLALHGSKVIVNYYRGKADAEKIVDEIRGEGGKAIALQGDVSDAEQVRAMVDEARHNFGNINILVNNAVRDFRPTPFMKLTWDDIQKDIDVTAKGAFNCCKEIIPLMLEDGGGKIINISTVATDDPPQNQTKYVVSKSALVGLTRSLSIEYASKNIQVNMVVPNFVETDLVAHIPAAYRKKIASDTPSRRNASPIDVAQAVVFLASSYSSFTTGQKIMVTGGGAPYL